MLVEGQLNFFEELSPHDWVMQPGMGLTLVDDLANVDAVAKEVEDRATAEWLPARNLPVPARPELVADVERFSREEQEAVRAMGLASGECDSSLLNYSNKLGQ